MRFEIVHHFDHPLEDVEAALLDPEVNRQVAARMQTILEIEPLELVEEAGRVRRRVRYLPQPLIKRVGLKKVEPRWMEWTEESEYDLASHRMTFVNRPRVGKVAALMDNRGSVELRAEGSRTRRVLAGELKIKVPILGRIAEKIIHKTAVGIVDEEARVLGGLLAERRRAAQAP